MRFFWFMVTPIAVVAALLSVYQYGAMQ